MRKASLPEEVNKLVQLMAKEMAVDGYYAVAGMARPDHKPGSKVLTLWDGQGLFEATWEPISAFMQPHGGIHPIFRSYLVDNNEAQLINQVMTLSERKKKK